MIADLEVVEQYEIAPQLVAEPAVEAEASEVDDIDEVLSSQSLDWLNEVAPESVPTTSDDMEVHPSAVAGGVLGGLLYAALPGRRNGNKSRKRKTD